MDAVTRRMPDTSALAACLATILSAEDAALSEVAIVARTPNPYESSFPMEIVTYRLGDGRELQLLCKYAAGYEHNAHGHRGGIAHEAQVYRSVLKPLGAAVPRLYGSYLDVVSGDTWLMVEYLADAVRVNKAPDPDAMALAARWIARFHAAGEAYLARTPAMPIPRYDATYYQGWADRTWLFAEALRPQYPWLETLCQSFAAVADDLAAAPRTIIHGEYYPRNVLYVEGAVWPVDWESAALGVGEIDLAMLIDEWPDAIVEACEQAYIEERWPSGAPVEHARRLAAARLYVPLRWLGDRPEWVYGGWIFERLHDAGRRLGLI